MLDNLQRLLLIYSEPSGLFVTSATSPLDLSSIKRFFVNSSSLATSSEICEVNSDWGDTKNK